MFYAIYWLALAVSISIWFIAVRAPLWMDETGSYWLICKGFAQIPHRETISSPAYSYILWFSTKIIGTSEIALRVPSILAMLGAVYLLYLAARELFDRRNDSNWLAALFGLSAAWILWFHYLFAVILPAFVLCFFVIKTGNGKVIWRQFGIALAAFALAGLPLIPGLRYLFSTAGVHVFEPAPTLWNLISIYAPGAAGVFLGIPVVIAVVLLRSEHRVDLHDWRILVSASLALIPVLILFGVSALTPIHCFVFRHNLEAVGGIAFCWTMLLGSVRSRLLRLVLCMAFVATNALYGYLSPTSSRHQYTWKYALEAIETNASTDNAPVLICSPFVESNVESIDADMAQYPVKESKYFAMLSYYRLSVPVVPLSGALNSETMRDGSRFLQEAAGKHERFLAAAYEYSYYVLDWLAQSAAGTYTVQKLGVYDGIEVLEFVPRPAPSEAAPLQKPSEPGLTGALR
ncbi:MAG: glycosyltransferase family 39 protein [Terracidiphilus sp.]